MRSDPAPLAVFGYRRPRHFQRVLEALSVQPLAKESSVHFFLDGPKGPEDRPAISEVRALARRPWGFARTFFHEPDHNLGIDESILSGAGRICREFGRVISVEDDVLPLPGFLDFLNQALDRYQGEDRVLQISGFAYPLPAAKRRAMFLPLTSCWGWGTWDRAWKKHHWDPAQAERDLNDFSFRRRMDLDFAYPFSSLLQDVLDGRSHSWDGIWYWNFFRANGLALFPRETLVQNIGWDGSGTHEEEAWDAFEVAPGKGKTGTLEWPPRVECRAEDLRDVRLCILRRERRRKFLRKTKKIRSFFQRFLRA